MSSRNLPKGYSADIALQHFMHDLLQSKEGFAGRADERALLTQNINKLPADMSEQEARSRLLLLNEQEEKARGRKRYLDKEKVKVLDKLIFPSMANLSYFFRCLTIYPQLREVFEDDVKDLLGVKRNNPQENNYGFIFFDLLRSILLIGEEIRVGERDYDKGFRLRLNQVLQEIVWAKVDVSLANVFKNPSAQRVVADDFNRVWAWTRMLAESVDQSAEDNTPPHRTIRTGTYQLKPDGEIF